MTNIVITGAMRTPIGALLGQFKDLSASDLGAVAIKSAVEQSNIPTNEIDWVLMGNVLGAGQGQAPARQAALKAGLSIHSQATTLNKMCGSGMQAVIMGKNAIIADEAKYVVAGGMESMSNAPHLLKNYRNGQKFGHGKIYDHMALDGLEDAYEGHLMGVYADEIANEYGFTRVLQDDYAIETLCAAQNAKFAKEIAPVSLKSRKGDAVIETDELPLLARAEKIRTLKPAFNSDGTVTAANASAISDGAAALILSKEADAKGDVLAKIIATSAFAHAPNLFTTAPVYAIKKALSNANWSIDEVDLWEINEAFAIVSMIAIKDLGLKREKVNVHGGACALGHPIGASGARIIVTLINALKERGLKKGVASLCIGGGEATAICIEV